MIIHKQHMLLGILTICAILVLGTLFYVPSRWYFDWQIAHQTPLASKASVINDKTNEMIAAIPSEHLFGKSFSKGQVPITNLQLLVTGIVKIHSEHNDAYSKAYISIAGQPGKIYQIGDRLPYGVRIYDITPDTVILENDGHLEKLPLPRERLAFKPRSPVRFGEEAVDPNQTAEMLARTTRNSTNKETIASDTSDKISNEMSSHQMSNVSHYNTLAERLDD